MNYQAIMFIVAKVAISIYVLVIAFEICWNNIQGSCYKSKYRKMKEKISMEFFPYDKKANKYSNHNIKKIKVRDIKTR